MAPVGEPRTKPLIATLPVLIISDAERETRALSTLLKRMGLSVVKSNTLRFVAYILQTTERFQATLVDLDTINADPSPVLKRLMRMPNGVSTCVVPVSSRPSRSLVLSVRDAGVHKLLTKPLDPVLLARALGLSPPQTTGANEPFTSSDVYTPGIAPRTPPIDAILI